MSQSSPITHLASLQINHDTISIELLEPNAMPPMVRIVWPPANRGRSEPLPPTPQPPLRSCSRGAHALAAIRAERRL